MSTFAAEASLCSAVAAAEAVRQNSKAAAFNTWNFGVGGPYSTYLTALVAADVAFITAVNSAASAAAVPTGAVINAPVPHAYWAKVGGL